MQIQYISIGSGTVFISITRYVGMWFMNVSFGASALYLTHVKKFNMDTHKYQPCRATLVKINSKDKQDIKVLSKVNDRWDSGLSYLGNIIDIACGDYYNTQDDKIYALTLQTQDYENLDPYKVLGVALINCSKDSYNSIDFIQADPAYKYSNGHFRFFKNIGKAMLRCIKKEAGNKVLKVFALGKVIPFYEKYGFVGNPSEKYTMFWNKTK